MFYRRTSCASGTNDVDGCEEMGKCRIEEMIWCHLCGRGHPERPSFGDIYEAVAASESRKTSHVRASLLLLHPDPLVIGVFFVLFAQHLVSPFRKYFPCQQRSSPGQCSADQEEGGPAWWAKREELRQPG